VSLVVTEISFRVKCCWQYLLSWWLDSWGMGCSLCPHPCKFPQPTAVPSLWAVRSSSTSYHCWWNNQRLYRWGTVSLRASAGQVLTPAAAPGIGHLGQRTTESHELRRSNPMSSCLNSWVTHLCDLQAGKETPTSVSCSCGWRPWLPENNSRVWKHLNLSKCVALSGDVIRDLRLWYILLVST
jgi:hypothetical protein